LAVAGRQAGRRFAVLTLLTQLVIGIKVFGDVRSKVCGPVDTAAWLLLKQNTPTALIGFFSAVTWSGAAIFLLSATAVLCTLLLLMRRPRDAMLLPATMVSGWALTYASKMVVNSAWPELRTTSWY